MLHSTILNITVLPYKIQEAVSIISILPSSCTYAAFYKKFSTRSSTSQSKYRPASIPRAGTSLDSVRLTTPVPLDRSPPPSSVASPDLFATTFRANIWMFLFSPQRLSSALH